MKDRWNLFLALLVAATGPAKAEIEHLIGERDLMVAHDHSGPERVGPIVQHHHHGPEYGHVHDHGDDTGPFEFVLAVGGDSRYVTEGRDNLDDGGIAWADVTGHMHALGGSVFGDVLGIQGYSDNYQELNLTVGYEREIGPVTVAAAATYLWFPKEDGDDDDVEIGLGAEWVSDWGIGLAGEAYWSVDTEGWFSEFQVFYELEVDERFTLVPSVILGVNQGYVDDEHDGFNHVAFQLEAGLALTDHLEIVTYGTFLEPIDDEDGESLRDLVWIGGAISYTF